MANKIEGELVVAVLLKVGKELAEFILLKDETFKDKSDEQKVGKVLSLFVGAVVDVLDLNEVADTLVDKMKREMDSSKENKSDGGGKA